MLRCAQGKYINELCKPRKFTDLQLRLRRKGSLVLKIPMHNWGGAFVANAENVYSNEDIARKEGLRSIELLETHEQRIKIVEAEKFFKEHVFHNGGLAHNRSGVIKIDVEGYEEVVLRGIASSLPCSSSVCIIFENWNAKFENSGYTSAIFR